jgi:membrane protein
LANPLGVKEILKEIARIWGRHRVSRVAAALAYYAVFTLAPLAVMLIVVTRTILGRKHALAMVEGELQPIVGNSGTHGVDLLVRGSASHFSSIPLILAGILVLFAAFAIFMQVQEALDDVWGIPENKRGGAWKVVGLRLHVLIVIAALALLALAALFVAVTAGRLAAYGVSIAALAIFLAVAYWALPNVKIGWKSAAIGALVTAAILLCGEALLSFYFRRFHPETVYGAAGSFILVLLWIYYSAQLFLFGAVLTHVVEKRSTHPPLSW